MKKPLIALFFSIFGILAIGQQRDSSVLKDQPKHFISINPINTAFLDQAGIYYEYRHRKWGIGLAAGYKYVGERSYSRLFIVSTYDRGAFEYYKGFFVSPQLNWYMMKPRGKKKNTLCYPSLRFVYKYLTVDSTNWHKWDGTGDHPIYRKQIDHAHAFGTFLIFGVKHTIKHFLIDFNFGPGWIHLEQYMTVFGESHYYPQPWYFPHVESDHLSRNCFSFTINLSLGVAF